jgi:hypothetical protein
VSARPIEEENMVRASIIGLTCGVVLAGAAWAQTPTSSSSSSRTPVELVGCVSQDPGTSGSFMFDDSGGGRYRLTGKSVRKYAGRMVHLVGGPQSRKLSIRGGLWPSPNVAAQGGALDPAQESIARQPGGAAAGTGGTELPEFRVVSVRGVEGSCRR